MSGKRVLALYAAVLLGFAVVLCRLYFLAENHTYAARAEAQSTVRLSLPARRGSFYDAQGQLLTGLEERWQVVCFPGQGNYDRLYACTDAAGQARDVVLQGRDSKPSRPVRISVHLHPYGDGRKLLLSRDVTALEQADAMRRDFVANVSHEIRTPLTVLIGFIETLQTLPLSPQERARYLGMMSQQASRMQSVVQDLLTLSRLEGSPLPGMTEWTPVQALMQRCEDEARGLSALLTQSQARPHVLEFPPAEQLRALGEIAGVPTELQSALSNLISNALRYTPAGGTITVAWERAHDGAARFSVRDTGPGIAPEHIPRLTERFYRVDRSRSRETGGTGLGLAIVKHVLQRHGASLDITSELGKGSTFSVTFPASRLR